MNALEFDGMPWFRMYTDAVDDEKLRLLAFSDRWHFVELLCCKSMGLLENPNDPLFLRKISKRLRLDIDELVEISRRLSDVGLIDKKTLYPIALGCEPLTENTDVEQPRVTTPLPAFPHEANPLLQKKEGLQTTEGFALVGGPADSFERFWKSWPSTGRKVAKAKCREKWVKLRLELQADVIIARVEAMKRTPQWQDGYEPAPMTYLNQRRWEDDLPPLEHANSEEVRGYL